MKKFNTTAVCIPSKHYMVDISKRVKQIKAMVDEGEYFTINRGRQYGKTTTLTALYQELKKEYEVVSLSFEGIGQAGYKDEQAFVKAFCRKIKRELRIGLKIPDAVREQIDDFLSRQEEKAEMDELFDCLLDWCEESDRRIVLIIDEIDSAANNQVFLDFLSGLRDGYINRDAKGIAAFQSVILAGVTDIKHLKSRIRGKEPQGDPGLQQMSAPQTYAKVNSPWSREEIRADYCEAPQTWAKVNSPWNIATDFNIDMSLSEEGIDGMLREYAADHEIKIDTAAIARQIRDYTNGYPYLVSRICQKLDENMVPEIYQSLPEAWTAYGVDEAVKMILAEKSTLFDSLTSKLINYPEIRNILYRILMYGERLPFNIDQEDQNQMLMYGFIHDDGHQIAVSNRIFETRLYNLFLSDDEMKNNVFSRNGALEKNIFVEEGCLNMQLIMEHFIRTFTEVFGSLTDTFKEEDGRKFFLLYLKPIINGTGNYYIEAKTRDQKRTDVIIDYLGRQYIIELKIWHGERYNAKGEKQISEYLDYFGLSTGYMLSFNFNKKKETGVHSVKVGEKLLYEGTV